MDESTVAYKPGEKYSELKSAFVLLVSLGETDIPQFKTSNDAEPCYEQGKGGKYLLRVERQ